MTALCVKEIRRDFIHLSPFGCYSPIPRIGKYAAIVALIASFIAAFPCTADPFPYAPIANPLPDTTPQLSRDSITLQIGRVLVNQAGYRPDDEKLFYYVGGSGASFDVLDAATDEKVASGTLTTTGQSSSGSLEIQCYHKAQLISGGAVKYSIQSDEISGTVYEGHIPDLPEGSYKIKVGDDISVPFIIHRSVYGMVKDALLKFYGVARCGPTGSWFHPGCHLKDAVTGGWHDAGDHIKVPQSMGYTMAVLGLCAAALPDRDTDRYGKNHAHTVNTDGIPDVLYEAKIGTDFVLNSYDAAGGSVASMQTEIGGYGPDHQWWGRPEYQDGVPPGRGGPPRPTAHGLGGNTAGSMAAGCAFVGKLYEPYDAIYAAQCIEVAKKLYDYGKANPAASYSAAMHGGGMTYDELALAALGLWWATGETTYKNDLLYDRSVGSKGDSAYYKKGGFDGGWFVKENPGPQKTFANTCWDNLEVYALWGLYRLILKDASTAQSYGLTEKDRLGLIEDILYCLIVDIADVGAGSYTIELPRSDFNWKGSTVKSDPLWGWMHIQDNNWMPNRYQSGNITELFCYVDIASEIEGKDLPNSPASTDWKTDEVKNLLLKQVHFMLGMNPWDISMVVGTGHKNLNHPHHRAANPELQNTPGAFYEYRPPVGALSAGYNPTMTSVYDEFMGGMDGYYHTEVSIDAVTAIFLPMMGLALDDPAGPPSATVRIVYVGCDTAIIEVRQSRYGTATVRYKEESSLSTTRITSDSSGMMHTITLSGLLKGTVYAFDVLVNDVLGNESVIRQTDTDGNESYFTFTTPQNCTNVESIHTVKVCRVTADSAEIFWYTPGAASGSNVVYGSSKPPSTVHEGDVAGHPTEFHYVKIGGLQEQTDYWFYVESGGHTDDNNGNYYHFRTPVEHVEFDIRAIRYEWSDMPALGMNIVNQDVKAYDSLDIRLYFRAKDGFENDLAARLDIGIMYDEAGFQQEFSENTTIRTAISSRKPVKLDDTYDPSTEAYAWYLSIPLTGVEMKSGSRIRLDVIFDRRSPWPPHEDLMNQPPEHQITDNDWSFGPHSRADGDPVDYGGVPERSKQDVDSDYWAQEVNQYICVYRKGEYVWGYSPSEQERKTKKTHYELTAQITSPLNNPSEEYVAVERTVPVVDVKGWATITGDGVINDIWVNGGRVDNISDIATYNAGNDRWDLSIPVPVENGPNVVDITIFGGPDSLCTGCYGCDFSNHHFFVEFSGAEQHPSTMILRDTADSPLADTVAIDTTDFYIIVTDKNGDADKDAIDTLEVLVRNPGSGDTLMVKLVETGPTSGTFRNQSAVDIVNSSHTTGEVRMTMNEGDWLTVFYQDPTDPSDTARVFLYTRASFPIPQAGAYFDSDGDGAVDSASVSWSMTLDELPDSLLLWFPSPGEQRVIDGNALTTDDKNTHIAIDPPFAASRTGFSSVSAGEGRSWSSYHGTAREHAFPMADRAGPVLTDKALVQKAESGSFVFTLTFSEPLTEYSVKDTALLLKRNGSLYPVSVEKAEATDTKGQNFTVTAMTVSGIAPRNGDSLLINFSGFITDLPGNKAHRDNRAVPVEEKLLAPSIISAWYQDNNGDGIIDRAILSFEKAVNPGKISLKFEWEGSSGPWIGGSRIIDLSDDSTILVVDIRGAAADSSGIATAGTMNVAALFEQFPGDTILSAVNDSAAPVIIAAIYAPGTITQDSEENPDTLTVMFSEPVRPGNYGSPFSLTDKNGDSYSFSLDPPSNTLSEKQIYLVKEIIDTEYPSDNDSIQINPLAGITDSSNAGQSHAENRQALLTVQSTYSLVIQITPNPFSPGNSEVPGHIPQSLTSEYRYGVVITVTPRAKTQSRVRLDGKIVIYDLVGNRVNEGDFSAESNSPNIYYVWNGRNLMNRSVGSGTYLAIITVTDDEGKGKKERVKIGVMR
ncbi:MAG: hypothetical protein GF401_11745 [Chitinivibrionales bacterium]|nr:hypothetical protein [Chitinivibrionales bacterium]